MKRMRAWLCGLWMLVFGFAPVHTHAHAQAAPVSELERLARAVASHPEDPDLLFALAQRLAESEQTDAAVERLSTLVERWPDYRPEASLQLGRLLFEQGRAEAAVPHLERAAALEPASGPAQLYLGLALQACGRGGEAESSFERAAQATPELSAEAWLLAGLSRLARGDRAGGDELLARALAADPDGESGRNARLVLEGAGRAPSRLRLQAYGGMEYDSNATLDSGDDFTGLPSAQSDGVVVWGSAISIEAVRSERFGVLLGAAYDQTSHLELHDWDVRQYGGALTAGWRAGERLTAQLDARISHADLDGDPYLLWGGLRPSLVFTLGPRAGWLRVFGGTSWYRYDETPASSALERDGFGYGSGLVHGLRIPGLEDAEFSWYASWERFDSDAKTDTLLGFEGDYDRTGYGGGARVSAALPWSIWGDLGVSYLREDYANENLVDYLTDDGVGTTSPKRRSDDVWEARIRLLRPVTRFVDLELSTRYSDNASNVDLYRFDRWVVGLAVRIHTP